jgi:non-ribosomal peptide synthetase component E (peptide arylation enzyme)
MAVLDAHQVPYWRSTPTTQTIRGGENIGRAEVEDALLLHDAISTPAVVGLSDQS